MKKIILLLFVFALSFAQYYDIAMVRADNNSMQSLVYDDNSTSYKDNSIENPDVNIRICALDAADLQGKYVSLAYADGSDGDYIILTHFPAHITSVPPSLCVYETLEISSFRAWYPSIPYAFISDSPTDYAGAERWKLSRLRGWMMGSYTVVENRTGAVTTINVTDALEDTNSSIVPDVDYLVIGLVREDFTTMDTAISSPNNAVTLNADSATATYSIFINGIGPDLPPYVEIITPEPITYDTGTIPFTYIMYDDDDIVDCWYILDGTTVDMPACGPAYILNVAQGTHTLVLYGEDTTGNIGSDSVTFTVGEVLPGIGGGSPGKPYYPTVPSPPPEAFFSVNPEDIYVIIDYPKEGTANFTVRATTTITEIECFVKADFEEWTTVEISSETINENRTIIGTIIVDMPQDVILDYNDSMVGALQCIGKTNPSLISSAVANVHLIINKPIFEVENKTVTMAPGDTKTELMKITNIGEGNATAVNITAEFTKYEYLLNILEIPVVLEHKEEGYVRFVIDLPDDIEEGVYWIPLDVYELERQHSRGFLILRIFPPEKPFICLVPDLGWTVIILLMGLMSCTWIFKKKHEEELAKIARRPPSKEKEDKLEKYRRPFAYALAVMGMFFIVWVLVVLALMQCTYAEEGACVETNPLWTLVIPLLGLIIALIVFKMKLNEQERKMPKKRPKDEEWERYKKPLMYALAVFAVFFIAWIIVILIIPKCA